MGRPLVRGIWLVVVAVGALTLSLVPRLIAPEDRAPLPGAGRVTVLPLFGVGITDVTPARTPALAGLMEAGASGMVATRAAHTRNAIDALERLGIESLVEDRRVVIGAAPPGAVGVPEVKQRGRGRDGYLTGVDELVARVRGRLADGELLVVVGLTPPGRGWELTPLVILGHGVPRSAVWSPSTHRSGVVTPADVSATIRAAVGGPRGTLRGQPLRIDGPAIRLDELHDIEHRAALVDRVRRPATTSFVVGAGSVLAWWLASLVRHRRIRPVSAPIVALCTVAAWPLATYGLGAIAPLGAGAAAFVIGTWGCAVAVASAATLVGSRARSPGPALLIAAVTVVVIVGDLVLGGPLQRGSVLGYSPHVAVRFYGLGNEVTAVLLGAVIALAVLLGRSPSPRGSGSRMPLVLLGAVALVIGSPTLGADMGGLFAAVVACSVFAASRSAWRPGPVAVGVVISAGLVTAALAVLDHLLSGPGETHMGRFVGSLGDGTAGDVVRWKWEVMTGTLDRLPWLLVVALVLGTVLAGWRALGPTADESPSLGLGIAAILLATIAATLVNDSGLPAAVFTAVWAPVLVAAALTGEDGADERLAPRVPQPVPGRSVPTPVTTVAPTLGG